MDPVAFLPPPPLSESAARFGEATVALLLTVLARTTVVLLVGLLAGAFLERRAHGGGGAAPAAVRAAVYRVTLAATALVLLVTVASAGFRAPAAAPPPLVRVRIPGLPQPVVRTLLPRLFLVREFRTVDGEATPPAVTRDRVVMVRTGSAAAAAVPSGWPPASPLLPVVYGAIAALYALGATLLLAAFGVGLWRLRRLAHAARTIPADTRLGGQMAAAWRAVYAAAPRPGRRPLPRLAAMPGLDGPFIADSPALPTPTVFVPTDAAGAWTDEEARAVFAHELAHHARRDGAWNLAARVLSALLWCQPLVHLLLRRLDDATEEACDREALAAGGCAPQSLARCLLALAERREGRRRLCGLAPTLGAASSPFRSSIGRRVARILDSAAAARQAEPQPRSAFSTRLALGLLAGTVIAPVAAASLVSVEARPVASVAPAPTAALRLRVAAAAADTRAALVAPLPPPEAAADVLFWRREEASIVSATPRPDRSVTIVTATTTVREEHRRRRRSPARP